MPAAGPQPAPVLCAAGAVAARRLRPDQRPADHQALLADVGQVLSLDGRRLVTRAANHPSVFTEKAPTRAFSWLKAPTSAFTFKTLLRQC